MTAGGRAKGRGMQREYSVSVSPIGPNPKLSSLASLFQTVHIAAYFGILQRQTLHKHKDDYQRWKSHIAKSRENKFQQNPQQSCHLSGGCGFLSGIFKRWRSCPCLLQLHCECPSLGATELGLSTLKLPKGAHPTPDPLSCSPAPTYLGRLHFPKGTLSPCARGPPSCHLRLAVPLCSLAGVFSLIACPTGVPRLPDPPCLELSPELLADEAAPAGQILESQLGAGARTGAGCWLQHPLQMPGRRWAAIPSPRSALSTTLLTGPSW